MHFVTKKGKE